MKRNKAAKLFLVLLCSLFMTGCWDNKELDNLTFPLVSGFDLATEKEKMYPDDKYLVSVAFPIFYEEAKKKFSVDSVTGNLIGETRGRRNSRFGEEMIIGQLQVLLFGDELAEKDSISQVTDIISRNPKVKATLFMAVVDGRAVDMMNAPVTRYPNTAEYLKVLIKNIQSVNFFPNTSLFEFNRAIHSYHAAPLLPLLKVKKDDIVYVGSCIVDTKPLIRFGREETETVTLLRGEECHGYFSFVVMENEDKIAEATLECKNTRKVKISKAGDKYKVDVTIDISGDIVELKKEDGKKEQSDINKAAKKSLEALIKSRAEAIVVKMQKQYKIDIMQISNQLQAHTRKKLSKEDLDQIIQDAEINVDVKVNIENAGGKI